MIEGRRWEGEICAPSSWMVSALKNDSISSIVVIDCNGAAAGVSEAQRPGAQRLMPYAFIIQRVAMAIIDPTDSIQFQCTSDPLAYGRATHPTSTYSTLARPRCSREKARKKQHPVEQMNQGAGRDDTTTGDETRLYLDGHGARSSPGLSSVLYTLFYLARSQLPTNVPTSGEKTK